MQFVRGDPYSRIPEAELPGEDLHAVLDRAGDQIGDDFIHSKVIPLVFYRRLAFYRDHHRPLLRRRKKVQTYR
jgi:hypothetical protein